MTYGQIRYRVTKQAPRIDLALIDGYLLDRYTSILDRLKWERQAVEYPFDTEAGEPRYTLPANLKIFGTATIPAEYRQLLKKSRAELDEMAPGRPAGEGIPEIVALTFDDASNPPQMQVELYPPPDDVYTVVVAATAEAPAIAGSATTLLPWVRESALVAGALADAYAHLKEWQSAEYQTAKYEEYLADMVRTAAYDRGPIPIKQAAWLTRHNLLRAMRDNSNRTGPRLP